MDQVATRVKGEQSEIDSAWQNTNFGQLLYLFFVEKIIWIRHN